MTAQLALNLRLRDGSSFENFYAGANAEAVARLGALIVDPVGSEPATLFLSGETASGKSHLLQAACRFVQARGGAALYVPLAEPQLTPDVLEAAEEAFLICIDDLDRVAGDATWESALFALYELARANGARLVAAGNAAPAQLGLRMPELATRLAWGAVYQLHPLDDSAKLEAVRLRARNRGFELPAEVARYILNRYPRDMHSLFALLERIDVAALARQRRVTIPFLRSLEAANDAR
ncbi:MAG: DnaA regulatory inactivator Hda [Sulfurifustaceae bacterium]